MINRYTKVPAGAGSSITEVVNYTDFVAGSDGDVGKTTSDGRYWVYNGTLALWMPPDVQPSSLEVDYDCSVIPTAATPVWTGDGTVGSSSDGSVVTINDNSGAAYQAYQLADAQLSSASNCGMIVRARVSAQSAGLTGYKAMLALRPSTTRAGALAIAYGVAADDGSNIGPVTTSTGAPIGTIPNQSPANSTWQNYFIYYLASENQYRMGVVGTNYEYVVTEQAFSTSYINGNSVFFGCYSTSGQATLEVDYVKAFTF